MCWLLCSEGYRDEVSRPPTVKLDDIKSMDLEEEEDEEGGWAGHHEDVDYSKEVVFSDSSDEERPAHSSEQPLAKHRSSGVKGEGRSRGSGEQKVLEKEEEKHSHGWEGGERGHSPMEKHGHTSSDHSQQQRHWQHKEHEKRHEPPDPPQRHEGGGGYHNYPPQRPGPYPPPPPAPQYPPNYHGGYPMYPPPPPPPHQAFGSRGSHHYPPSQHMGGGGANRYPPHPHRGPGHKRGFPPEREDYGWGDSSRARGAVGSKKKWEDKEIKPTILAKGGDRKDTTSSQSEEKQGANTRDVPEPLLQRTVSESSEPHQEGGGGEKPQAQGACPDEVGGAEPPAEEQAQPTRRGNQPKIMLRKLGDKEGSGSGGGGSGGRSETKDRPADLKNIRQSDSKASGDSEDQAGSDAASRAKMAWNVKDRGPITSPKTLYEPEGKKSADKFKKYHAHIQEPHSNRGSGKAEQEELAGEGGEREKVKSPVDKKESGSVVKHSKTDVEPKRRDSAPHRDHPHSRMEAGARGHGRGSPDVQGQEFPRHHQQQQGGREKLHHRKEESRLHRGGSERRQEAAAEEADHKTRGDTERRQESGKFEDREGRARPSGGDRRQDLASRSEAGREQRGGRGGGGGGTDKRQDNTSEHRGRDAFSQEGHHRGSGGGGAKQPPDRRGSDQRGGGGKDERGPRRKDVSAPAPTPHGYGRDQEQWDKGRQDKKSRREGGGGGGRRGSFDNSHKVSERSGGKRVSEEEPAVALPPPESKPAPDQQPDSGKQRGGAMGVRGQAKKGGGARRDDRKPERGRPSGVKSEQQRPLLRGVPRVGKGGEESPAQRREKGHPGLGYSELIDIESGSDLDTEPTISPAPIITTEGRGQERRGEGRGRGGVSRSSQPVSAAAGHRKPASRRGEERRGGEERKRGNRKLDEEDDEIQRRVGVGRGRGRDRWEGGGHPEKPGGGVVAEESKKKEKQSVNKEEGGMAGEAEESTSTSTSTGMLESSGSLQKFDVSKYDLNSHKVAIVDDIGRQNPEEGLVSPTEHADFVEVTSKKSQKEKMRKEKEEQRKEERRVEDQRKKKKPNTARTPYGVDKPSLSANKPCSAWSTSEGKTDSAEVWSAAPGAQLKAGQSQQQVPWVPTTTTLPPGSGGFGLGKGGGTGDPKAAVPHTAELVGSTSSEADMLSGSSRYSLFGFATRYPHFSPAMSAGTAPTMLDAAVDSTIGTVTSPRTVPSHHTPHIMDQLTSALPLDGSPLPAAVESPLSETLSTAPDPTSSAPLPAEVKHVTDTQQSHAKGLPPAPRFKSGTGRGRGTGQRGGMSFADRRERRKGGGREQVGRSEKQINVTTNEVGRMWCALCGILVIIVSSIWE